MKPEKPVSVRALRARIQNFNPSNQARIERVMANIVLCQMLPSAGVRGGTGLKIRMGDQATRASKDLDLVLAESQDDFLIELKDNLSLGWNGFTGVITPSRKQSNPTGVPNQYIIHTVDVKLFYLGNDWLRQELDLGHDEIGDTSDFELEKSDEINKWFELCGLPLPSPVPVIKPHHQIAQKIHALTANPIERIHDLVDLQVIFNSQNLDLTQVATTCAKLFKFRKAHAWPPVLEYQESSVNIYSNSVENTGALKDLTSAVDWFNKLIQELHSNT